MLFSSALGYSVSKMPLLGTTIMNDANHEYAQIEHTLQQADFRQFSTLDDITYILAIGFVVFALLYVCFA